MGPALLILGFLSPSTSFELHTDTEGAYFCKHKARKTDQISMLAVMLLLDLKDDLEVLDLCLGPEDQDLGIGLEVQLLGLVLGFGLGLGLEGQALGLEDQVLEGLGHGLEYQVIFQIKIRH